MSAQQPSNRRGYQAVREAALILSTLLALASGVAQLVVDGIGRVILVVIFVVSFSVMCVRAIHLLGTERIRRLNDDLDRYRSVLNNIVFGGSYSFKEELTLSYNIGKNAKTDTVTEERITTAGAALQYRAFGLTVDSESRNVLSFNDVGATWWCESTPTIDIELLPLTEGVGKLRALALFRPPAHSREIRWGVRYLPQGGLWEPLRSNGRDLLTFHTVAFFDAASQGTLESLTVKFTFPSGITDATVTESMDRGVLSNDTQNNSLTITWKMTSIQATVLAWSISVPAWRAR